MPSPCRFRLLALVSAALMASQPASAQSVLRDAETETLLQDMAAPLVAAAGLNPRNVDIVLLNDPSVNAFVAGGQAIYVNSGLINALGGELVLANHPEGGALLTLQLRVATPGATLQTSEDPSA